MSDQRSNSGDDNSRIDPLPNAMGGTDAGDVGDTTARGSGTVDKAKDTVNKAKDTIVGGVQQKASAVSGQASAKASQLGDQATQKADMSKDKAAGGARFPGPHLAGQEPDDGRRPGREHGDQGRRQA